MLSFSNLHIPPAGHHDRLPRDVAEVRTCHGQDRAGSFCRSSGASDWNPRRRLIRSADMSADRFRYPSSATKSGDRSGLRLGGVVVLQRRVPVVMLQSAFSSPTVRLARCLEDRKRRARIEQGRSVAADARVTTISYLPRLSALYISRRVR